MKKIAFYSIALLTACTMLMVGCQPKDEPKNQDQPSQQDQDPPSAKAAAVVVKYSFELTDQMLEVADFTVTYFDNEGKQQTEQVTSKQWSRTSTVALPCNVGAKLAGVVKADFDPDKYEVVKISKSSVTSYYLMDADGKEVHKGDNIIISHSQDFPGSSIPGYFEKYKDHIAMTLLSFDAEGNVTKLSEWE